MPSCRSQIRTGSRSNCRRVSGSVVEVESDSSQLGIFEITGVERIRPEISAVLGVLDVQLYKAAFHSHDRYYEAVNTN